jgi:hypothetical protein
MRNWSLLLLGVAACQPAESAVLEDAVKVSNVTVSDAERQRMVDSTKAWIERVHHYAETLDSAGMANTYLQDRIQIVSAGDGDLWTSRDSVAASFARFSEGVRQHEATVKLEAGEPLIDVVAPGVVAVTYPAAITATNKKGQSSKTSHAVYSAVLVEREGHLWIVQEHQSNRPEDDQKK